MKSIIKFEKSKDGYNIIRILIDGKWKYIGSKYNEESEIEKFISVYGTLTGDDTYIVLGLGYGEHINELLKKSNEDAKILVFEPNFEVMKSFKQRKGIKEICEDKRINLFSTKNSLENYLRSNAQNFNPDMIKCSIYSTYKNIYVKEMNDCAKMIREFKEEQIIIRNTEVYFSQTWFETLMSNLSYVNKSTPINNFKDKYKDVPAIIVSAGPSLEKNIEKLKGVNNALIISGGRTLKPLVNNNIEPSILAVFDPGKTSYDLVKEYIGSVNCPLLYYDGTNKEVVKNHNGAKIISGGNSIVDRIMGIELECLNYGGSVAHASVAFAIKLGCNPIILIGQDLAYTNDKGHADIALLQSTKKINRQKLFNNYKKDNDIYVKDIYGKRIRTSIVLNDFRLSFEKITKMFKNITFIDATEGGALIDGTKIMTLEEALKLCPKKKIEDINQFLTKDVSEFELKSFFKANLDNCIECIRRCKKAIKLTNKLYSKVLKRDIKDITKATNDLEKIDEKIMENIYKIELLFSLFVGEINKINLDVKFRIIEGDSEWIENQKCILRSKAIYKGIYNILEKYIPIIEKYV